MRRDEVRIRDQEPELGATIGDVPRVVLVRFFRARDQELAFTLGTASQWKGNVVVLTSVTLVDTANLIGRALARNGSVSLGTNNTITLP